MSTQPTTQKIIITDDPEHPRHEALQYIGDDPWASVSTCGLIERNGEPCGKAIVRIPGQPTWAHGYLAVGGQVATPDGTTVPHADGPVTPEQEYTSQVRYCDVCESVEPGEIGEFVWPEAGDAYCPGGGAASGWTCNTCETDYECEGEIDWSL